MNSLSTYLTFKGNCEEAFNFYAAVFEGEITITSRYKEMPPDQNFPVAAEDGDKLMHITLQLNPSTVLQGADAIGEQAESLVMGNNFSISVNAESTEEVDKLFAGLSDGGVPMMQPEKTFWGSYFGFCKDKFGISWMVSCQA